MNQEVIEALKRILNQEKYFYLEYKEPISSQEDFLRVKVVDLEVDRHIAIAQDICMDLKESTGISFFVGRVTSHADPNSLTNWTQFNIKKNES